MFFTTQYQLQPIDIISELYEHITHVFSQIVITYRLANLWLTEKNLTNLQQINI